MSKHDNSFELNWNNFKAKYNGREHEAFERLSYILFCLEYGQQFGVFRYLNQTGIETNPIWVNGEQIGFQSKFYDNKINKADIIDSITKAKNKHPDLKKILLYTNKEVSESSNRKKIKPNYMQEIEDVAKEQNIQLGWRVPSHFERQLIIPTNNWLYEIFFSLDKGLVDFINEIKMHTVNYLETIKTEIKYNDNTIKIEREGFIKELETLMQQSSVVIITGKGGCGKTAIIKELYHTINNPLFVFKANEFANKIDINELFLLFGKYTCNDFIECFQDEPVKIIVIDSAEKLADIENLGSFQIFIQLLIKNGWKIVFTIRDSYLNYLYIQLIDNEQILPMKLTPLLMDKLITLSYDYKFELPYDQKLCELLRIPFYLSEYLNIVKTRNLQLKDFKRSLWDKQIMNSQFQKNQIHIRRENAFIELIKQKNSTGNFIIHSFVEDNEALDLLCKNEIIKYDEYQHGYFIIHDIYEEWGLEKFIDITYQENIQTPKNFLEYIGSSLAIRRSFRSWVLDKISEDNSDIFSIIDYCINNSVENFWRNEVIISIMLSSWADKFFEKYKSQLLENNQELLLKVIFLLKVACKDIDYNFLKKMLIKKNEWLKLKYIFTVPKGKGWEFCIQFIHENKDIIKDNHLKHVIPLLQEWVKNNKSGNGTKFAGQVALFYLSHDDLYHKMRYDLNKILLQSVQENRQEIKKILDRILSNILNQEHRELIDIILKNPLEVPEVIVSFPNEILELAKKEWLMKYEQPEGYFLGRGIQSVEEAFGFKSDAYYYPPSAFQTPILILLKNHFVKTISFIVSILNNAIEKYAHSELAKYEEIKKIKITIDEQTTIEQYSSKKLWGIYRARSVSSHILESVLMALEKVLLEIAENEDSKLIEAILLRLLTQSNSVAMTAVVASIVVSQPEKLYKIAKILFNTWDFFCYDLERKIFEPQPLIFARFDRKSIYEDERKESNKLQHRAKSLEDIALLYQLVDMKNCLINIESRRKELCQIWDKLAGNLLQNAEQDECALNIKCFLARVDCRNLEFCPVNNDEQSQKNLFLVKTKKNPELDKQREEYTKQHNEQIKYMGLYNWASNKFEKSQKEETGYDKDPHLAFTFMQEIWKILNETNLNEDFRVIYHAAPAYIAAVLLRDYHVLFSKEEQIICKEILIEYARKPLQLTYSFQYGDGTQPAIETLDVIIKIFPEEKEMIQIFLLYILFNNNPAKICSINCLLKLWNSDFNYVHTIWLAYLNLKSKYEIFFQKTYDLTYENKHTEIRKNLEEFFNIIERFFDEKQHYYETDLIKEYRLNILNTAFQMLPNGSCNEEHVSFCLDIIPKFVNIFDDKHDYKMQYFWEINNFVKKFSYYLLQLPKEKIKIFLTPLLLKKHLNEDFSKFLLELFIAQDAINNYESFWYIWLCCYDKIKQLANDSRFTSEDLIENYLFAGEIMNCDDAKSRHSLQKENMKFYYDAAKDMGSHPHVLYSIARVFNGIASNFIEDGLKIIHLLVSSNNYEIISNNTMFYIETLSKNYYLLYKTKIRTDIQKKKMLIDVLTFLIEHGSDFGYILRDEIL